MSTYRTADFWAPALHANTVLHLSVPEPGPSTVERHPAVRAFPIKHGEHEAVGVVKRIVSSADGLLLADDGFRVSHITLPTSDPGSVPTVSSQATVPVPARGTSVWTGLVALDNTRAVSSLSTGRLTLHANGADVSGTRKIGAPVLTLSTPAEAGSTFALGGKEVEISLWDAERAFSASAAPPNLTGKGKDVLAEGEVWRAKNVPHNNLQLRVPVHHLCSTFIAPNDIVTGTKGGNVRRYDTRQRRPVSDWAIAREGGIAHVAAAGAEDQHTLFYSDGSNLVGALDLRTGKMQYAIPGLAASAASLLSLPPGADWAAPLGTHQRAGLATLSSDATLRVCGVTPAPAEPKGNAGPGKKASVLASVGGVGVGSFTFAGYGDGKDPVPIKERAGDEDEDDSDAEVDDEEEDEMWEGMGEVGVRDAPDTEDEDSDEDEPPRKKRR